MRRRQTPEADDQGPARGRPRPGHGGSDEPRRSSSVPAGGGGDGPASGPCRFERVAADPSRGLGDVEDRSGRRRGDRFLGGSARRDIRRTAGLRPRHVVSIGELPGASERRGPVAVVCVADPLEGDGKAGGPPRSALTAQQAMSPLLPKLLLCQVPQVPPWYLQPQKVYVQLSRGLWLVFIQRRCQAATLADRAACPHTIAR